MTASTEFRAESRAAARAGSPAGRTNHPTGLPATPATSASPDRPEPRSRGRLVLAEQVVEKIAAEAASELPGTAGRSGGLLGIGADADPKARPKVGVDLAADSADLAVSIGVAYPASIRAVTQRVREHVTSRVEALTGVDVRRVDIDVTFLTHNDVSASREVLR